MRTLRRVTDNDIRAPERHDFIPMQETRAALKQFMIDRGIAHD
jgi:hypothetical protein